MSTAVPTEINNSETSLINTVESTPTVINEDEKSSHKKRKRNKKHQETSSSTATSSSSSSSTSFKNYLDKLVDNFSDAIRELRRKYKYLNLDDKMDKMFTTFYIDRCDPKSAVFDTYESKLVQYNKNAQLAFLHTMAEIDSHINDINDIMYPDEESDLSDLDDGRSEQRKEMDRRMR